jgi:hypothetical protein
MQTEIRPHYKTCSVCLIEKIRSDFPKTGAECKACKSLRAKKYNEDNADTLKIKKHAYYEANKEERKADARSYYYENKEDILAKVAARYTPEELKVKSAIQYQKHRPKRLQYAKDTYSPDARRLKKYGLTKEAFDGLMALQDRRCAGCLTSFDETKLCVDHDHETGAVRGLLCGTCNRAAGLVKDNPENLERLAAYLRFHAAKNKKAA